MKEDKSMKTQEGYPSPLERVDASIHSLQEKRNQLIEKRLIKILQRLKKTPVLHLPDDIIQGALLHVSSVYTQDPEDPLITQCLACVKTSKRKRKKS